MSKKKTARKAARPNLSVVPVTSRERTGTNARQINLRAAMILQRDQAKRLASKSLERAERLDAAINALGSLKKGD